jgi:hypothetical protein
MEKHLSISYARGTRTMKLCPLDARSRGATRPPSPKDDLQSVRREEGED